MVHGEAALGSLADFPLVGHLRKIAGMKIFRAFKVFDCLEHIIMPLPKSLGHDQAGGCGLAVAHDDESVGGNEGTHVDGLYFHKAGFGLVGLWAAAKTERWKHCS